MNNELTAPVTGEDATPEFVDRRPGRNTRAGTFVGLAAGVVLLLAGLVVPALISDYSTMSLFTDAALLGLLVIGIAFLGRHLGVISLGHTAFFGGAAYAFGIGVNELELGLFPAFVFAVLTGTVLSVVMGVLVVKASGIGFLMLTLALSQALYQLSVQQAFRPLTGSYDGLLIVYPADAQFLGLDVAGLQNSGLFWPCAWIALVLSVLGLWLLGRSSFGRVLGGIRENEERMRFSGFGTYLPRLAAFVASGFVASLGGALFALNAGFVSPDILGFSRAGDALIAALVGGMGTILGPLLGTGLFMFTQAKLNIGGNLNLFTGVALMVVLVVAPGGLSALIQRLIVRLKRGEK
ncbi:branched-chain amino acid ABC transporter permease [Rhodococcoides fascians]|uniref:branched-chain amino acid ABC transporter permease n=1 Tax=Rhodococcoides fascians TaxID=1828 RepID=UPI00056BA4BF|nr:branched-chain amino acid ABC transporter permease [Rhodococcus fascians]